MVVLTLSFATSFNVANGFSFANAEPEIARVSAVTLKRDFKDFI